jgi:chromosome partitioning protein
MKVSIIQNKGGVGKSTVTSNLSSALSLAYPNKKILIVDLDGQGNQAITFGYTPSKLENTIYDVLVCQLHPEDAIIKITDNLHLLPANDDMNYFELDTIDSLQDFTKLKKAIDKIEHEYDYIFFDSPPELKIIFANLMITTDEIYIPFEPDSFNAHGLLNLINKINKYKKEKGITAKIKGIIPMKVRDNTNLHKNVLEQVKSICKDSIRVMETYVPHSVKYAEYIATFKKPVILSNPESRYSKIYWNLLKEVLENESSRNECVPRR